MNDDSCIGINYAHSFPKCFRSLHTLLSIFALHFVSPFQLLSLYQFIQFLTCTRIPCRDSHCENGLVRCCLYRASALSFDFDMRNKFRWTISEKALGDVNRLFVLWLQFHKLALCNNRNCGELVAHNTLLWREKSFSVAFVGAHAHDKPKLHWNNWKNIDTVDILQVLFQDFAENCS